MAGSHRWVDGFLERASGPLEIDRLVEEAPGVDAHTIMDVLGDQRLGSHVIEAMSDLMHPTDSMYFDAIFGAFHGQVAIRNWLVPTMSDIAFIEFVPTAAPEAFRRDGGTSSVDEWQMWANLGDERMPLPRGVSTRHYADGWVRWNADVYDTSPMRRPPTDPAAEVDALPAPPRTPWPTEPMEAPARSAALEAWLDAPPEERGALDHGDIHTIMVTPGLGLDPDVVGPLWHPTESRLHEPTAEYAGRDEISAHLSVRRARRTSLTLERVGEPLFNGSCTAFEWVATAPGGPSVRGTSVCRYTDGLITYAADYYDTAEAS
ncbi:MAG: nuclear transport factor 2 family protein [Actinomycetota bacterium]